ncbi:hypothetical protein P692DRAFT_20823559 [Suillus brevipes Sb2]|nr:hypothetical protein P692DRAFT_20823559 [Suillus brevipes Sb2]
MKSAGEVALDIRLLVGEHRESSLFLPTLEGEEGGLGRLDGRGTTIRPSRRLPEEGGAATVLKGRGLLGGGPGNGGVSTTQDPARARENGKEEVVEVIDFVLEVDDATALDETKGTRERQHEEIERSGTVTDFCKKLSGSISPTTSSGKKYEQMNKKNRSIGDVIHRNSFENEVICDTAGDAQGIIGECDIWVCVKN